MGTAVMTARCASVITLSLIAFTFPASAAEPPIAKLISAKSDAPPIVEISGLDKKTLTAITDAKLTTDEWRKVARFVVDVDKPEEAAKKPPIVGEWSVTGTTLKFEPLFPLTPGVKYRVFCDFGAIPRTDHKGETFSQLVSIPKPPPGPRVRILSVYPSTNRLPENTLRMYIYFSGQVTHGDVYSHFKLVRDDGKVIPHPFVEVDEELWTPDGLRLTLLFDPGRVKNGLTPREELGVILEERRSYTFSIDANWPDADGRPLLAEFKKSFTATAPDNDPIWPNRWTMISPRAGSDAPLLIRLGKPLDYALLSRMLWVADANGNEVAGTLTVGGGERVVSFAPKKPWKKADYKLVINEALEDVCGNRVGTPFEVDVFKQIPLKPMVKLTERSFIVK